MELTSALLPMRLRIIEDSGIASAMSTWTRLASSTKDPTSTPPPTSQLQRVWDDQCCKIHAETLLDVATDHVLRARLLAACSPGSGDWLDSECPTRRRCGCQATVRLSHIIHGFSISLTLSVPILVSVDSS